MKLITQDKTNWKFLLITVIFAIIAGGTIFYCQHCFTNKNSESPSLSIPKHNPPVNKNPEILAAQIVKTRGDGGMWSDGDTIMETKIDLIDSDGKTLLTTAVEAKSQLEKYIGENIITYNENILINESAIMVYPDVFYLFMAIKEECGNGGCPWHVFKYVNSTKQFYQIKSTGNEHDELFGFIDNFYFSSNNKDVAIKLGSPGGACCRYEDFSFIDLVNSVLIKINNWPEMSGENCNNNWVYFSEWTEDNCFIFKREKRECDDGSYSQNLKFCPSSSKIEALNEEISIPASEQLSACLIKGSKITMADNNYKNIEDIKIGDFVKSFSMETKEFISSEVVKVIKRKDLIININNELMVAPDEPIYSADGKIKMAIELKIGDILFFGKKVGSIEYSTDKFETYDLILKNSDNFLANGYLVRTPE